MCTLFREEGERMGMMNGNEDIEDEQTDGKRWNGLALIHQPLLNPPPNF